MRIGIYNRYWATGGGAEKYGGVIAEVLAADGEVELLTHDPVDVDWLAERLHLDLAKVSVRQLDDEPGAVTSASEDYDLFVNVSFMSADRSAAPGSLYVVHFPTPLDAELGGLGGAIGRRLQGLWPGPAPARLEWGTGFHPRDPGRRAVAWTNGEATLHLTTRPGRSVAVQLVLGHRRPPELGPTPVSVEIDGEVAAETVLPASAPRLRSRMGTLLQVEVQSRDLGTPVEVKLVSDTFQPAEVLGGDDRRRLGVPLQALRVVHGRLGGLRRWLPLSVAPPASSDWITSYGTVVCNSEFTREWVRRWWETDGDVLHPPVTMHQGGTKEPVILNVGRFFAAEHGHSKKQLELVRAFRDLCDRGVKEWTLHLAGGCAEGGRAYADEVRRAADGYPVELHLNASGEELADLYGRASIYWHASGLGEDPERHPGRLEHFGITTVEAMSAGAVPVVIGLAGQLETVRHGVDGFHFRTLDGLCAMTDMLIDDIDLRHRMSVSATARAREFSIDAFESRLRHIVDREVGAPSEAGSGGPMPVC